ncbi:uncharacterized protein LOC115034771 [Acyrthosiphon pisum]|uniref:Uncharacterized protein n=1 Tax=Acyrthosiphon pisum TaxID=7029 RepID=A0A8R2NWK2_ACYPI|nr:uncharacterized protein LOC115034771 [Acyrthosiphon pisum]XP_029348062.1 uncharacterized protein LOC115034771 [Acyrthosiphon pisum]
MGDVERDTRAKERTILRRDGVVARIHHIHQLATNLATNQAVRPQLAVAIQDLDALWASFEVENNDLLSILSNLNLLTEFPVGLDVEIRSLVVEIKAVWNEAQPALGVSVGTVQRVTYETTGDNSSTSAGSGGRKYTENNQTDRQIAEFLCQVTDRQITEKKIARTVRLRTVKYRN